MQEKQNIEELIARLFLGSITTDEKMVLTDWLNESNENKAYLDQLRNIWHVGNPAFLPEAIDVDRAHKAVMRKIDGKGHAVRSILIRAQRVAAVLVIPLILLVAYQYYTGTSRNQETAWQEIIAPFGMQSKITLPDGSIVWLNSGSQLKYPVRFDGKERNIVLSGEAFFSVESDKKHPFIVETGKIRVVATGTDFNVEAYPNDSIIAVTLLKGIVDVVTTGNRQEKLFPDQRLVFHSATNDYKLNHVNAKYWSLWKDGILAFRNEPLRDVFKRIGRTFNVDIVVKDNSVGRQLYRATFQEESLEEILRLLKLSAPIRYNRIGRELQDGNSFNKDRIEVFSAK